MTAPLPLVLPGHAHLWFWVRDGRTAHLAYGPSGRLACGGRYTPLMPKLTPQPSDRRDLLENGQVHQLDPNDPLCETCDRAGHTEYGRPRLYAAPGQRRPPWDAA